MLGASTPSLPVHATGTLWNLSFIPNTPLKSTGDLLNVECKDPSKRL